MVCHWKGDTLRLSENIHLPFDKLMALSRVEGLRYPHPSSLRRTSMYTSFLGISEALHLDIFHQPLRSRFCESLVRTPGHSPRISECEYHRRCP